LWLKYRRAVALAEAAVILSLPFIRVGGESALRFDLNGLKLHFFGTVLWVGELYLVLAATLFLFVLFFAATNVMGRVWCGWLCPQTVLIDFAQDLGRAISRKMARFLEKIILVPVSALVAVSLIWYFVPPADALRAVPEGGTVTIFFISLWAVLYGMLALLGRKFCTTICPYSMIQGSLFDKDTLVVAFDEARMDECKGCEKCVVECPVGIDIRDGLDRKCIACARCIDACVSMTRKRRIPSLVDYTGKVLRPKALWLSLLAVLAGVVFITMLMMRADVRIVVTRDAHQPAKGINSYSYRFQNNTDHEIVLDVSLDGPFTLVGDNAIDAGPFAMKTGTLLVKSRGDGRVVGFTFRGDGIMIEKEAGFL
jgi:cytochrome c oxidase accessory protein FixG